MSFKIDRVQELDRLIRAAHAELGRLQLQLVGAYERALDPGALGADVADLGRKIQVWKREKGVLCRSLAESASLEATSQPSVGIRPASLADGHIADYRPKGSRRRPRPPVATALNARRGEG